MTESLLDQIKRNEGYRSHLYKDTEGYWTIGYGCCVDKGISEPLAAVILEWQVNDVTKALATMIPFWKYLSQARKEVFINMSYNLGLSGFLGFRRMLAAAEAGNVSSVCQEMKDSKWYKQVGSRADELIEKYRIG